MTLIHRIITQLENDQFRVSDGRDEQDQEYRRAWNAGVLHAIMTVRTIAGLAELRDATPRVPRETWLRDTDCQAEDCVGRCWRCAR